MQGGGKSGREAALEKDLETARAQAAEARAQLEHAQKAVEELEQRAQQQQEEQGQQQKEWEGRQGELERRIAELVKLVEQQGGQQGQLERLGRSACRDEEGGLEGEADEQALLSSEGQQQQQQQPLSGSPHALMRLGELQAACGALEGEVEELRAALAASEDIRMDLSRQLAGAEEGVAGRVQLLGSQVAVLQQQLSEAQAENKALLSKLQDWGVGSGRSSPAAPASRRSSATGPSLSSSGKEGGAGGEVGSAAMLNTSFSISLFVVLA